MNLRISQIAVQPILLDEYDAPHSPEQIVFQGDKDGTAPEKLTAWLEDLPAMIEKTAADSPPEE